MRTGRWPDPDATAAIERKFNPWHDPDDGRFTSAGQGRHYGSGGGGSSTARKPSSRSRTRTGGRLFGGAGASGSFGKPLSAKPEPKAKPKTTSRGDRNFPGWLPATPALGRSLAAGRYPFGLLHPRHGAVSSGMDISFTWTTRAIRTKSMCRSWVPEPKRRAHDRRSEMRVSLTGSQPMMAAISSLIGSTVPMMPLTILRRTGPQTVAVTAWSNSDGPTLKPKARMCRSR